MSSQATVIAPEERGSPLSVIGTQITVLSANTEASQAQVTFQSGPEGTGPAPHSHPWEESFYVTRGKVIFHCGDSTRVCEAGTFVHVPAGAIHAFSYGPGGGEMLEITGRDSGAIGMFTALDREIPPGPPDIPKLVEVARQHGTTFHL